MFAFICIDPFYVDALGVCACDQGERYIRVCCCGVFLKKCSCVRHWLRKRSLVLCLEPRYLLMWNGCHTVSQFFPFWRRDSEYVLNGNTKEKNWIYRNKKENGKTKIRRERRKDIFPSTLCDLSKSQSLRRHAVLSGQRTGHGLHTSGPAYDLFWPR